VKYDYIGHPQRFSTRAWRRATRRDGQQCGETHGPSGPVLPGGYPPRRTGVVLSVFAVHRPPAIWENARTFDPDRETRSSLRPAQRLYMRAEKR
jgi:hypothetical protein